MSENILQRLLDFINEQPPMQCDGCLHELGNQLAHSCLTDTSDVYIRRHLDDALRTVLTVDELLDLAYKYIVDKLVHFENDRLNSHNTT